MGEGREGGRGEGGGSKVPGVLLLSTRLLQLPFPCISEMLSKEHFPEEHMPGEGQCTSTRLSGPVCKEAIAPAPGNGAESGLTSSLQV